MKRLISVALMALMLFQIGSFSASAWIFDVEGEYYITTVYEWTDPALAKMVEGLPEHTVVLDSTVEKQGVVYNKYFLVIEDKTKHNDVKEYLISFDTALFTYYCNYVGEAKREVDTSEIDIITDYSWDSAELSDMISNLPEHTVAVFNGVNVKYIYSLRLADTSLHGEVYEYLKQFDNITVELAYYSYPCSPVNFKLGDVTGEGGITAYDASVILQHDARLLEAPISSYYGDINKDGSVDSYDAMLILQYDAGLIDCFD